MHAAVDAFAVIVAFVPTPVSTVDPDLVTPGPWGFAAILFIALAVTLLVWDMLRRVRRGRYRAEVREELDAEQHQQQQDAADAERPDDTGTSRSS
ncbi:MULTISPECIES: hypothetical protein [unclassified Microbacterium]|uniref:hypothetical protein n=1 Tax=unclassified Microbacterium TaxID=2609290 RepID=UPI00214B79DB|nr:MULTISPECIES: hypothetical protein [unclassified Microbacterium]MCR2784359.1 hypothetical protein [Microbacterium sp. zg.B96]MDL5350733.1 hypothetical protein [Microbacterium sp. zg-YB36]WIM14818.1 hypothetical protein QNO11_09620 [Microbacterium sp. zg-B96]